MRTLAIAALAVCAAGCRPTPASAPGEEIAHDGPTNPAARGDTIGSTSAPPEESPCPTGATPHGAPPPDGSEVRCVDADGLPHGPWSIYFSDGTLAGRVEYEHGVEHGSIELHWPTVSPRSVGQYAGGRRAGVWLKFGADGEVIRQWDHHATEVIVTTHYAADETESGTAEVSEHREAPDACGARPPPLPPATEQTTATVVLLDTSGSLSEQVADDMRGGVTRIASLLGEGDELAVVTTSSFATTLVPMHAVGTRDLGEGLAKLRVGGGSDLVPGLIESYAQLSGSRGLRHVILFTDARVPFDCLDEWVRRLRTSHTIVSVVGPRDEPLGIERIAAWGGDNPIFLRDPSAMVDAFLASHRRFVARH